MIVPAGFAADMARREGAEGKRWVSSLPEVFSRLSSRWGLSVDGTARHGFCSVVQPVVRADGRRAVLKLGWPHDEGEHEALALSTWDGDGAVRLLDHAAEDWALLLERLDPDASLEDEPLPSAIEVVGGLIRRLDRPAPAVMRSARNMASAWVRKLSGAAGVPGELLEQAVAYCVELGPRTATRLVNEDLHYANVLRGEREPWLVIDPKPLAGDPELGLIPLLWNRFGKADPAGRLEEVVEAAGLDLRLARRWAFVRAVVNWVDAVEEGEEEESDDPAFQCCPAIARALA